MSCVKIQFNNFIRVCCCAMVLALVLLLTEVSRAACSSPTANVGSLDWQSPVFKYCDGTTWKTFGGGRTSCPTGFSLIGVSGSADAFCISSSVEAAATWLEAVTACYNKESGAIPRARLCSPSEWTMACVSGIPTGMTGKLQWVADSSSNDKQAMGKPNCDSFVNGLNADTNNFRCCFR